MKKLLFIILILLSCTLLGCSEIDDLMISLDPASEFSYEGWKNVELDGYGSIKIPNDWRLVVKDGYYLIEKPEADSYTPVLFQSKAYTEKITDASPMHSEVRFRESVSASGLSNGPIYGKRCYLVDGVEVTLGFIEISSSLDDHLCLLFLAEDPSMDETMLRKIAASFSTSRAK